MNDKIVFVVKVLLLSTVLSFLVKYGGRLLPLEPNSLNALLGISIPPVIMLTLLIWRSQTTRE